MEIVCGKEGIAYEQGYSILERGGAALVAMSPGNSYFKADRIAELLATADEYFPKTKVFIPDAYHTLRALGYDHKKATKKARLKSNNLKNHCTRADGGVEFVDHGTIDICALEESRKKIHRLYMTNQEFKEDAHSATREVLYQKTTDNIEIAIEQGVKFLLDELAVIDAIGEKNGPAAIIYHKSWPILERFIAGDYDRRRENLGFVIVH